MQAAFAFAAGGVVGTGLARGTPQKIPAVATDLIFAAIGEELGLIGAAAVIAAFALLVVIGLRIAQRAERPFEQLLATGLTAILGVQSCLIIGGCHTTPAADGYHAAFRLLRRFIDHRQLDPRRVAAAHQQRRSTYQADSVVDRQDRRRMIDRIRKLGVILGVAFCLLLAALTRIQVVDADKLQSDPRNTRALTAAFSADRGAIQTIDGVLLARSVPSDDQFKRQREYPEGELFAPVTGYLSFTFGAEGAERSFNKDLSGGTLPGGDKSLRDLFDNGKRTADVTLTINAAVQRAAAEALGGRRGAVVALDPTTGAILAMVNFPSYDPSPLAGHKQDDVRDAYNALESRSG